MKENLGTGHEKKDTQVPGFVLGHRQIIMPQNQLQIMENRKHIDFEATKSNPVFNVKIPDYARYASSHHRGLVIYQLGFLVSKPRYILEFHILLNFMDSHHY